MANQSADDFWTGAPGDPGVNRVERMAHNVASVADIPWETLPDGPARGCLLEMAYAGADVRAFRAADGDWYVRVEGRIESCAAWAARFCV